jgi:hypothetical protein
LVALYNTTDGANWTTGTNWLSGTTVCNNSEAGWYGITCDESNNITQINLPENNLSGDASLSGLSYLQTVDFSGNNLKTIDFTDIT